MNRSAFLALAEQATDGDEARAIPALRQLRDLAGRALAAHAANGRDEGLVEAPPSGTRIAPVSEAERHWLARVLL